MHSTQSNVTGAPLGMPCLTPIRSLSIRGCLTVQSDMMTSVITFTSYREISINVTFRCEYAVGTLERPSGKPHHSCQGMGRVFLRKEVTVVQVKYTNQVRSPDRTNSPRKREGGKMYDF